MAFEGHHLHKLNSSIGENNKAREAFNCFMMVVAPLFYGKAAQLPLGLVKVEVLFCKRLCVAWLAATTVCVQLEAFMPYAFYVMQHVTNSSLEETSWCEGCKGCVKEAFVWLL